MPEAAFQWLRDEVSALRALRFHVFERSTIPNLAGTWDPAITSFLSEFGSAQLYRAGVGHRITMHWPRPPESDVIRSAIGGLLEFGSAHDDSIFVGPVDAAGSCLWKLDVHANKVRAIRDPFSEWLKRAGRTARRLYTLEEWRDTALDPSPFTADELDRLSARKSFEWTVERLPRRKTDSPWDEKIYVEITNRSARTLPYFTICVRWTTTRTRLFVDVSRVGPGEQRRIMHLIPCSEPGVIPRFYDVDDPLPEERDILGELRGASPDDADPTAACT